MRHDSLDGVSDQETPARPIRVLAADDHPIFLDGVASVLAADPDIELVGRAHSGVQALERYGALRPDVVLMDLQMREMDGIEATELILTEYPGARIIMLTTFDGDGFVFRALKAGVFAYILKNSLRHDLLNLVRSVHQGRRTVALSASLGRLVGAALQDGLTPREMDVLRTVALGHSNKRVGALLEVSEETVKSHMKNVLLKLNANDRTHAVALAMQRGILLP